MISTFLPRMRGKDKFLYWATILNFFKKINIVVVDKTFAMVPLSGCSNLARRFSEFLKKLISVSFLGISISIYSLILLNYGYNSFMEREKWNTVHIWH
jgi:hypothetical protein